MATDWRAKHLVGMAVALLIGLAIGGLGPRSEVRSLRHDLDERVDDAKGTGRAIANIFRGRPWEGDQEPMHDEAEPAPVDEPAPTDGPPAAHVEFSTDGGEGSELPDESLDQMRQAMDMRQAQARAALREQADATDEQMAAIDEATDQMNRELQTLAEDFVAEFTASGGEPGRREMMVFAADTLDVLIGSEDAIFAALSAEQREGLDEPALDPLSYVDGGIVDILQELDR